MDNKWYNLYSEGQHLTEEQLNRYTADDCTDREAFEIERHTLECDLCADAIEGLLLLQNRGGNHLPLLDEMTQELSGKETARVIKIRPIYWASAAAAVAIIVISAFLFEDSEAPSIAVVTETNVSTTKPSDEGTVSSTEKALDTLRSTTDANGTATDQTLTESEQSLATPLTSTGDQTAGSTDLSMSDEHHLINSNGSSVAQQVRGFKFNSTDSGSGTSPAATLPPSEIASFEPTKQENNLSQPADQEAEDDSHKFSFKEKRILAKKISERIDVAESADVELLDQVADEQKPQGSLVDQGIDLYNKGKYLDAVTLLKNQATNSPNLKEKEEALYFLAKSQIELGQNDEAKQHLEQVLKMDGLRFKEAKKLLKKIK